MPKRFILCYLGVFGGPIYYYLANRLYFVVLFARTISYLLSLIQVYCSYYLFKKANLHPRVLVLLLTCLFSMAQYYLCMS